MTTNSIHSTHGWIRPFLGASFQQWEVQDLTDNSSGTIAAYNCYDSEVADNLVQSLCDRYQHVIIYACEPFAIWPVLSKYNNVTFFTDMLLDMDYENHKHVANWFMGHDNLYASACWAPNLLQSLSNSLQNKPFCFDALLGVQRPNREHIHAAWQQSSHKDKILLTYHGNDARRGLWHIPTEPTELNSGQHSNDQGLLQVVLFTYMPVEDGQLLHKVHSHMIVPTQIYNDCWYSIIAEGFMDSRATRLTEKTAKALVAERVFVYFGGHRDLERMKGLGFRTFGHVIDESYDMIEDDEQRWRAAWQQVEWLCNQDPHMILAKTQSQRQHNREIFLTRDWHANLRNHLNAVCAKY